MLQADTIIGLSSGTLPSGIAVIRISGPNTRECLRAHGISDIDPKKACLVTIMRPADNEILDRGICIRFSAPSSFTGEDCAELHVHGGKAVVEAILESLLTCDGVRLAEAGEFTKRAFENGKFDLTEVEGISDILASQTEAQRRQAIGQSGGLLRETYEGWRNRLIRVQALIEAEIDFSDEDDVPEDASSQGMEDLKNLRAEILQHLDDNRAGEIIREGFRVVIMGAPNAGKSSLLNTLAKRDVAIVTEQAGTTRDVIDVHLNIGGFEVIVSDTAGIRETEDIAEKEGIRRAEVRGREADFVIWLGGPGDGPWENSAGKGENSVFLISKDDNADYPEGSSVSCVSGHGIQWLLDRIERQLATRIGDSGSGLITRKRHRIGLVECERLLGEAISSDRDNLDIKAEIIRNAATALGRITGRIDVEDLLDVIFSEFCVGK